MDILKEKVEELENKLSDVTNERISHIEKRLDNVCNKLEKTNKQSKKNKKLIANFDSTQTHPLETNENDLNALNEQQV